MSALPTSRISRACAAVFLLGLGCTTVGPDYEAPVTALPEGWRAAGEDGLDPRTAELAGWWRKLEDPILDELVARALQTSLDVREARARVMEARALRKATAADLYPTLDAGARWERLGQSENTPFGEFVPDYDYYSAGFDAAWEIDLWGRVRRSVEAADAELGATIEDARDVAVSVAAETAINYVELRSFQQRAAIARDNVSLQEQTLELVRGRFEAGLVGESDVAQARTSVESTRSRVPALEIGQREAENRLAVLLGQAPGALAAELAAEQPIPVPPTALAIGVPADLLRRRADVRRAERLLAAETARIGMAEGELYPRLTLAGRIGWEAEDAGDLFRSTSSTYGFGPSLSWNVFDAGRLRSFVDAQEARTEQALTRWERTVLVALEETENAMHAFVQEQARRASLLEATSQARLAVELARTQYTEGLSDFQNVLVSERALVELEDELAASEASIATSLVRLYKALGGGWDEGEPAPPAAP